jgi:hypothetical protein
MLKQLALLSTLLTACLDQPTELEQAGQPMADLTIANVTDSTVAPTPASTGRNVSSFEQAIDVKPDLCDLLPADGACALLCDPGALAETIPPGTCADLLCQLTDGTSIRAGGCNP